MKSKKIIIGAAVVCFIALIPVYMFFNQAGVKESAGQDIGKHQGQKEKAVPKADKDRAEAGVKEEEKKASPAAGMEASEASVEKTEAEPDTDLPGTTPIEQPSAAPHRFLVVIDPGHQQRANLEKEPVGPGSTDSKIKVTGGTSGVATGKPEYQLTLEASLVLGELLESRGVKVIYTRTTHDVNLSNRDRAEIANQHHADLFIRIHADGSTDRNVRGLSVLTPAENSPYTQAIFEDSLKASQFILDETKTNAVIKVNGLSYRGDLSGFNWAKVPSTLVEMGFMSNPTEDKNLSDPVYLKNLLTNVADGIVDYASSKK